MTKIFLGLTTDNAGSKDLGSLVSEIERVQILGLVDMRNARKSKVGGGTVVWKKNIVGTAEYRFYDTTDNLLFKNNLAYMHTNERTGMNSRNSVTVYDFNGDELKVYVANNGQLNGWPSNKPLLNEVIDRLILNKQPAIKELLNLNEQLMYKKETSARPFYPNVQILTEKTSYLGKPIAVTVVIEPFSATGESVSREKTELLHKQHIDLGANFLKEKFELIQYIPQEYHGLMLKEFLVRALHSLRNSLSERDFASLNLAKITK